MQVANGLPFNLRFFKFNVIFLFSLELVDIFSILRILSNSQGVGCVTYSDQIQFNIYLLRKSKKLYLSHKKSNKKVKFTIF